MDRYKIICLTGSVSPTLISEPTQGNFRIKDFQGLEDMTFQMAKFLSVSSEMTDQMAKVL